MVAVIGDKVYIGTGQGTSTTPDANGTYGPLTFTWSVQTIPHRSAGVPLFLGDVDNDGDLDVFSIQFVSSGASSGVASASPQVAVVLPDVFGEGISVGPPTNPPNLIIITTN